MEEKDPMNARDVIVESQGQKLSLSLKVETIHRDDQSIVRLELSNPSDLTFLKYATMDRESYDALMSAQNISIPFDTFPTHFLSILDNIHATIHSSSPVFAGLFTFVLSLVEDEINNSFHLKIIQQSSFITIPLFSLPFHSCSKDEMIEYLHSIIQSYEKEGVGELSTSYQTLQKQYNEEIEQLKSNHSSAMDELKMTYERQLQSLQEQMTAIEEENTSTLEDQRNQWNQELVSIQAENTELKQQLLEMTSNCHEQESSLTTLQSTLSELQEQAKSAKSNNELEKQMSIELETSKEQLKQVELENTHLKEIEKEYLKLQNTIHSYEENNDVLQRKERENQEQIQNQTELIQSLSKQVDDLKKKCEAYAEEIRGITHTSKMKDRAISCLNLEINKLKMGSSYVSSL